MAMISDSLAPVGGAAYAPSGKRVMRVAAMMERISTKVENETKLPEGLRICAARVARSIYTLRNKRNIAHKNPIDPNTIDLALAHNSAAWIVAELLRNASGVTMQEAGRLIDLIRAPVGTLVEEIDGTRLVHAKVPIGSEVLILLHSHYPDRVSTADILTTLRPRTPGAVRKKLRELCDEKKIHGDAKLGYRLTQPGYSAVSDIIDGLNG